MMGKCTQVPWNTIAEFPKNGFQILSEYNFTYGACDYCPGEYWPDNKSGNHTLLIFATEQPLWQIIWQRLKKTSGEITSMCHL